MFCRGCGQQVPPGSAFCPSCGLPTAEGDISPRRRLAALLLCVLLGVFGAHRFYVGKIGTALLILFTAGGFFGLWVLVDAILIAVGSFRDQERRRVVLWT